MTKTPQLHLPDYTSKISEHADVRAGSPMPLGEDESDDGVIPNPSLWGEDPIGSVQHSVIFKC
jgi:hypothetical protein